MIFVFSHIFLITFFAFSLPSAHAGFFARPRGAHDLFWMDIEAQTAVAQTGGRTVWRIRFHFLTFSNHPKMETHFRIPFAGLVLIRWIRNWFAIFRKVWHVRQRQKKMWTKIWLKWDLTPNEICTPHNHACSIFLTPNTCAHVQAHSPRHYLFRKWCWILLQKYQSFPHGAYLSMSPRMFKVFVLYFIFSEVRAYVYHFVCSVSWSPQCLWNTTQTYSACEIVEQFHY